jgi:tetratricopeptide (TPR) repeat protein
LVKEKLNSNAEIKSSGSSDEFFVNGQRIALLEKSSDKFAMWFYSNRSVWHDFNDPFHFNFKNFLAFEKPLMDIDKNANNNYEAFVKKCNEFYEKEEYPKTIEVCTEAIKLKGDDPALYQIRGLSYFFTPDKPKSGLDALTSIGSANKYAAIADLTKCTQLTPTKPECFYALGYVQRLTLDKNELDKSAKSFSEAIRLKSTEEDVYYQRAEAYREYYSRDEFFGNKETQIRQRKELAVADYTKDIELRPTAIESRMGRGLVYLDLEKYTLSVADFTKALDILNASGKQNPDYRKGILENRARAYLNLGKNTEYCNDMKALGKACEK